MPKIINKIVKTLIMSDFFLNLGWGLLSPVFAIFVLRNITMQDSVMAAEVAGFAALFYWIPKSFLEIPIGYFLDKHKGEKDDFWFMVIGEFVMAFVPLGYLFSTAPWHIYLLQILYAFGMAMALPSWLAIFTRHIDKGREGFEWGVESTSIGTGAGIAGGLGGIIAGALGFKVMFIAVSVLNFVAVLILLFIRNNISSRGEGPKTILEKPVIEP
jgi:predicted MFS family arabinose efflux permease